MVTHLTSFRRSGLSGGTLPITKFQRGRCLVVARGEAVTAGEDPNGLSGYGRLGEGVRCSTIKFFGGAPYQPLDQQPRQIDVIILSTFASSRSMAGLVPSSGPFWGVPKPRLNFSAPSGPRLSSS